MSAAGDSRFLARPIRPGSADDLAPAIAHGGDVAAAAARYGIAEEAWLDLSTGINPQPYPHVSLPRGVWARLPQGTAEARLLAAARRYFSLPETAGLVAAPGSQALIQWLPRLLPPGPVAILSPTYGEHARAWALAGHRVAAIAALDEAGEGSVVVTHPNNPDGRRQSRDRLLQRAAQCAASGGLLVVDEAFADTDPEASVIGECGIPGLVVLRSFGKFFGLAGLRLGFAACAQPLARQLADALGPWAVSTPALGIAARAYEDTAWIANSRARLARAAMRLDRMTVLHGLTLIGGTDLFRLYRHDAAPMLAEHLARAGILVRRFRDQPQWLRFGLPGNAGDWRRLATALASWQQEQSRNV